MARKIEIEVVGDTSSLERALSRSTKTTQSSFQKMGKAAGIAGAAIFTGLAVVAKVGFDELAEGQKVAAQTAAVLKSTGGAANVTAKDVDVLAQSLSELSGVDDEVIAASENLLLTFRNIRNETGKGNDIFDQTTAAVLDMSVAMGTDLQSATLQVGKALQDPIRGLTALRRVGVSFTTAQEEQIAALVESGNIMKAQKIILAELNKEFGGSAKAAGETLPGQLSKARNAFDEVAATLVESLLPAVTGILGHLTTFSEWAKANPKQMQMIVIGLGALAAALVTASVAQAALNLAVLANPYVAAAAAAVVLVGAMVVLSRKFEFVRKHWQLFLIGFGGASLVVFATVAKAIIRHWGTIEAAVQKLRSVAVAAWNQVGGVVKTVASLIGSRVAFIVGVFQRLISAAKTVVGAIRAAFSRVPGILQPVITAFNAIVAAVNRVISAVRSLIGAINSIPSPGDVLGGVGGAVRGAIPGLQSGGFIERGGLARLHSGETVVPARVSRGGGAAAGAPGGPVVVLTTAQIASWLQEVNYKHSRGNGGRSIW